jgi:hypothetical protein
MKGRPPYFSLFILSGSALAYEILLMRLFSIIQWHHFAYMIIGLALLGYGISGAIVTIYQQRLVRHFDAWYVGSIIFFSIMALLCFSLAQQIPFNAEVILWDRLQLLYLGMMFLLLSVPFFFAATAICLSLMHYGERITRLYAMDLLGAGIGGVGIIGVLYWVDPVTALLTVSMATLAAGVLAIFELGRLRSRILWTGLLAGLLLAVLVNSKLQLNISPYKGLPQLLQVSGTQVVTERSSPLGLLQVVESKTIPIRHAPGLSLNADQEPLPQLAVFTDADNMVVLTKNRQHLDQLAYLDQSTSALAYHLRSIEKVLVLGAGGGSDILQAQYHHVPEIDGVELNPQIVQLVNNDFGDFTGHLYKQDGVQIYQAEVRDYLTRTEKSYALIQLALVDTFNASSSGLYALNESYLYTVEALQLYLSRLSHEGYLSVTRWVKLPPRDSLKLFASILQAMDVGKLSNPEKRVAMIRSWQTSTILVKNGEFSSVEMDAIRLFCQKRSFDLVYLPDIKATEVNRYNILATPDFYQSINAILGEKQKLFFDQYKFNLQPATDDQPYFHQFFKWSAFGEILSLRNKGGMPLIEWGYITLIITLGIAIFLSVVLIVVPVWILQRIRSTGKNDVKGSNVLLYFLAIGLAFLFVEIAMIQKFILFLHHPILSVSVTLAAFLVFSGVGSALSGYLQQSKSRYIILLIAITAIVCFVGLYILLLPAIFSWLMGVPVWQKVIFSLLLIAPLATFMGMPFPLALGNLSDNARMYIPWAWAINGCASVISAVLATILAIHFGFMVVLLWAAVLYLLTLLVYPKAEKTDTLNTQ